MAEQSLIETLLNAPILVSDDTFEVTNDIIWQEPINIENADAVIRNRKGNIFEACKVTIVDNVGEFIYRGLTKAATYVEDPTLKRGWKK